MTPGRRRTVVDFVIGGVMGCAWFVAAFGIRLLDPTYIDWLLWGDPAANYFGWAFYRQDPWAFPLTRVQSLGEGFASSIVFTDSIPWIAVLLKPFRALLSVPFQYFGAWLCLAFTLQGAVGFVLARRMGADRVAAALIAGLLLLSPPMLNRLTGHYALTAHWVVLVGLGLCLFGRTERRFLWWIPFLALLVLTQFYLAVMAFALWSADVARAWLDRASHDRRRLGACVVATLAVLLMTLWAGGFFLVEKAGTGSEMVGFYRLNALSLVNPEGYASRVLPKIPDGFGDYEGFAYLGLGMLGATLLALVLAGRSEPQPARIVALLPLGFVLFVLTVFAVSMWPAIGRQVIYAAPENIAVALLLLGAAAGWIVFASARGAGWRMRIAQAASRHSGIFWIIALVAAFLTAVVTAPLVAFTLNRLPLLGTVFEALRASGRMFWPAYYALLLWVFWVLLRNLVPRTQYLVLGAALAVQAFDLSAFVGLLGKTTLSTTARFAADRDNPLRSTAWDERMAGRQRLLVLHPNARPAGWEGFAKLASDHGASINKAYFNRERARAYEATNAALWADIEAGRFDGHALYVAYKDDEARLRAALAKNPRAATAETIDGFLVVSPPR